MIKKRRQQEFNLMITNKFTGPVDKRVNKQIYINKYINV